MTRKVMAFVTFQKYCKYKYHRSIVSKLHGPDFRCVKPNGPDVCNESVCPVWKRLKEEEKWSLKK